MKIIKLIPVAVILLAFISCGDPDVDLTSVQFESKIAVEAFLFCGETVKDIRITRNIKLGTIIEPDKLFLTPQENNAAVTINGIPLNFDRNKKTYYNNEITVEYGKSYRIEIQAEIDGKQLSASSTTITPLKGFSVINHDLGKLKYRDEKTKIDFKTSPGTDMYIFSILADSAGVQNFIYDNPYFPNYNSDDVWDDYNNFRFQLEEVSDIDSYSPDNYTLELEGYDTWFYGPYTVTVYAGDKNLRYYLATATEVQEMDGNFHEPYPIFEGDGIGVFASAIRETVTFTIIK